MKYITITSIFLLLGAVSNAQDVRDKVAIQNEDEMSTIDPGVHAYGIPWGVSEDEFIKQVGAPIGYIKLPENKTVMIYGKDHAFIFVDKKMEGLRITDLIIDWKFANQIPRNFKAWESSWKLSNGVHSDMSRKELEDLLGENLKADGQFGKFMINDFHVEVSFARHGAKDKQDQWVYSLYVTKEEG